MNENLIKAKIDRLNSILNYFNGLIINVKNRPTPNFFDK